MSSIEHLILRNLMSNEDFARKTLPYIKPEYFHDGADRLLFEEISNFLDKYNNLPSLESLGINLSQKDIHENTFNSVKETLQEFSEDDSPEPDGQWLRDTAEKFCQEKALHNALSEAIQIMDGKGKSRDKGAIPQLLEEALGVSFDASVGHDYFEDADARFEYYHQKETKLPFDLEFFNKITRGGVSAKTLNIILGGTNVGKTLIMCHFAAAYLAAGKNVLYITMEMAEEEISKRIDANCLNITMDGLEEVTKDLYDKKIAHFRSMTKGKLLVKQYPTSEASVVHFKALLNECRLKKKFKPDVIFIDYLNICASSRIKKGGTTSYEYVKSIAEELRGLAVSQKLPVWSATQTTRSGFANSDPELGDTSESFGLPATADFMFAAVSNEELEAMGQYLIKQLKNRYNRKGKLLRFVVGVDYEKMRLYDVEQTAQEDVMNEEEDVPVMSRTSFGSAQENEGKKSKRGKFKKFSFEDL